MIRAHIENYAFDELEPEISQVKGGPGPQTGRTHSRQSDGHLSPVGECFAPDLLGSMKVRRRVSDADERYLPLALYWGLPRIGISCGIALAALQINIQNWGGLL